MLIFRILKIIGYSPVTNYTNMNEKRINYTFLIGYKKSVSVLLFLLVGSSFVLLSQTLTRYEYEEPKMGTAFRLVFYTTDQATADQAATAAFQRVDALNRIFSDYEADSEVSRLSLSAGSGQKVPVTQELWEVLSLAQSIAKKSKGAFDITIGPLSKLWRRAIRQHAFPDASDLAAAKDKVCYKHIELDKKEQSVRLKKEGMRLDLGGIAKGYTVDAIFKVLQKQGITLALIDGGGDIYASLPPPTTTGWKVSVISRLTRTPSLDFFDPATKAWSKKQEREMVLYLKHRAVASSGNTYKFLEINGTKYSHIIHPKTGLGLTHNDIITVEAPNCALADALASTLSVLSPKKGKKLLKQFKDCDLVGSEE